MTATMMPAAKKDTAVTPRAKGLNPVSATAAAATEAAPRMISGVNMVDLLVCEVNRSNGLART